MFFFFRFLSVLHVFRGGKGWVLALLVLGMLVPRFLFPIAMQWGHDHDREVAERPVGEAVTAHELPVIDLSGRRVTTQATVYVSPLLIAGTFGAAIVAVGFVGAAMLLRRSEDESVSP